MVSCPANGLAEFLSDLLMDVDPQILESLVNRYESGEDLQLSCATAWALLLRYLSSLPEPLLTFPLSSTLLQSADKVPCR